MDVLGTVSAHTAVATVTRDSTETIAHAVLAAWVLNTVAATASATTGGASAIQASMARTARCRSHVLTDAGPQIKECVHWDAASATLDGVVMTAHTGSSARRIRRGPLALAAGGASAASACASLGSQARRARLRCAARTSAAIRAFAGAGGACAIQASKVRIARSSPLAQKTARRTGCATMASASAMRVSTGSDASCPSHALPTARIGAFASMAGAIATLASEVLIAHSRCAAQFQRGEYALLAACVSSVPVCALRE